MNINLKHNLGIFNDTPKFAVILDDVFGFVESKVEAEAVLNIAVPDGDIGNSGHGYCAFYPPYSKDRNFVYHILC